MNTPVSFELAKLLKEKGFEQILEVGRICRIQNVVNKHYEKIRPITQADLDNEWSILNEFYPTIAEVVMWLYEKHGIWIYTRPFSSGHFHGYIVDNSGEMKEAINNVNFNSPTEAYEAAIEYVLKNLI